jgi:hypothetical protein
MAVKVINNIYWFIAQVGVIMLFMFALGLGPSIS